MTEIPPKRRDSSLPSIEDNCQLANTLALATDLNLVHLDLEEVAQLARTNVRVIESLHQSGKGPPSIKIGHRTVRYRASDVLKWLAERSTP